MLPRPIQKFIRLLKSYSIPYKCFSAYSKVPPPHKKFFRLIFILGVLLWIYVEKHEFPRMTKNCPARAQKSFPASYSYSIHYGDHVERSELSRRTQNCPVWTLESFSASYLCSIHYGDHVGKSELSRKYLDRAFAVAFLKYWTHLRFRGL